MGDDKAKIALLNNGAPGTKVCLAPHLLMPVSVHKLLDECNRLTADMQYDDEIGFHFWPGLDGEQLVCGTCTNGARLIAQKFNGYVAGYSLEPVVTPTCELFVGSGCGGHDFAVVGEFIVDWWAWEYPQDLEYPVLTIKEGIRSGRYKPQDQWKIMADFRKQI